MKKVKNVVAFASKVMHHYNMSTANKSTGKKGVWYPVEVAGHEVKATKGHECWYFIVDNEDALPIGCANFAVAVHELKQYLAKGGAK